jgi:hypothetical protein
MCNAYSFSTVTMVKRTFLNVTFILTLPLLFIVKLFTLWSDSRYSKYSIYKATSTRSWMRQVYSKRCYIHKKVTRCNIQKNQYLKKHCFESVKSYIGLYTLFSFLRFLKPLTYLNQQGPFNFFNTLRQTNCCAFSCASSIIRSLILFTFVTLHYTFITIFGRATHTVTLSYLNILNNSYLSTDICWPVWWGNKTTGRNFVNQLYNAVLFAILIARYKNVRDGVRVQDISVMHEGNFNNENY